LGRLRLGTKRIIGDERPLPPPAPTAEEDEALLADEPEVVPPQIYDYGTNVKVGKGTFLNLNLTIIDTCLVTIGARTMFGPYVSIYSGCHPTNPELRDGIKGPEFGKEIHIGEDVWIGGNAVLLPGVRIGKGATVGAASVVTKVSAVLRTICPSPETRLARIML
jgi:acetyltransferase-like isoleucine patch superfamily enzyme